MRLLRTLFANLTTKTPKREFAHVHDVQIKWERLPDLNQGKRGQATGSMSRNGMFAYLFFWEFSRGRLVEGGDGKATSGRVVREG
jgi:hypothetical protein